MIYAATLRQTDYNSACFIYILLFKTHCTDGTFADGCFAFLFYSFLRFCYSKREKTK